MKPTKYLVITSIFPPSKAIKQFAKIPDWQVVVVGDKKTPSDWHVDNVIYLDPGDQEKLGFKILEFLPWNNYCRKMVGYLYAMGQGAELIADSDDDNEPYGGWPSLPVGSSFRTLSGSKFINIYKYFTDEFVWPRGLPLDRILEDVNVNEDQKNHDVAIWQFLADKDPDVDAIYRLTNNRLIDFKKTEPIVLEKGTACPINSQNTVFSKKVFPLMYLPAFVTFRSTDIFRGLVAQPLIWEYGYRLGFGPATVFQERNPHDYLKDFESEVPVFLKSEEVLDIAVSTTAKKPRLGDSLLAVYEGLGEAGIVSDQELALLGAWLDDVASLIG